MILYLSSQKFGNNEDFLRNWSKTHNKLLLISNALDSKEKSKKEKIEKEDINKLEELGFKVDTIDLKDYFDKSKELEEILKKYNSICVIGGNVFVLRAAMKYSGLDEYLKKLNNDYLYIGYSAGSIVMSKSIELFKIVDEPIDFYQKNEIIYEGLNLIDYTFIPHYKSDYHKAHLIEEIVNTCEEKNIKYKALKNGESIIEKR